MMIEKHSQDIVYALAVSSNFDHEQRGVCFAARASGLYRSDDGGRTWRSAYGLLDPQEPLTTTAIALSPDFTADSHVFAGIQGGVLRSFDAGDTWEALRLSSPPPLVSTLAISPDFADDGTLLAGTAEDGIFRSSDRGRHWDPWNFGLLDLHVLCLAVSPHFSSDETIYAGTESGLFRSTNGGRAWREVELPVEFPVVLSLAFSEQSDNHAALYVGTESHGLLYTEDCGTSWNFVGMQAIKNAINVILVSPDKRVLVASGHELLISHDIGQSWTSIQVDLPPDQSITSAIAPQGLHTDVPLLIGTESGFKWVSL